MTIDNALKLLVAITCVWVIGGVTYFVKKDIGPLFPSQIDRALQQSEDLQRRIDAYERSRRP